MDYGIFSDRRFQALSPEHKKQVLSGELTLDEIVLLDEIPPQQNTPPIPQIKEPSTTAAAFGEHLANTFLPFAEENTRRAVGTSMEAGFASIPVGARRAAEFVGDAAIGLTDLVSEGMSAYRQDPSIRLRELEQEKTERELARQESDRELQATLNEINLARQGAREGLSTPGKLAFDVAGSIPLLASTIPLGPAALPALGAVAAGEKAVDLESQVDEKGNRLYTPAQVAASSIGTGALEMFTELPLFKAAKFGAGSVYDTLGKALTKTAPRRIATVGAGEALGEAASTAGEMALDEAVLGLDYSAEDYAKESAWSALVGQTVGSGAYIATKPLRSGLQKADDIAKELGAPSLDDIEADVKKDTTAIDAGPIEEQLKTLGQTPVVEPSVVPTTRTVEPKQTDILQRLDERLAALDAASKEGSLTREQRVALSKEQQEITTLLQEQSRKEREGIVPASPTDFLSEDEKKIATNRLQEIRLAFEKDRQATGSRNELNQINERLSKINNDKDLVDYAQSLVQVPAVQEKVKPVTPPPVVLPVAEQTSAPEVETLQPSKSQGEFGFKNESAAKRRAITLGWNQEETTVVPHPSGKGFAAQRNKPVVVQQGVSQNAQEVRRDTGLPVGERIAREGSKVQGSQDLQQPTQAQPTPSQSVREKVTPTQVVPEVEPTRPRLPTEAELEARSQSSASPEDLESVSRLLQQEEQITQQADQTKEQEYQGKVQRDSVDRVRQTLRERGLTDDTVDVVYDETVDKDGTVRAGGFDQTTGRVSLNAAVLEDPADVLAVVAHEVSHALGQSANQGKPISRRSLRGLLGDANQASVNARLEGLAKQFPSIQAAVKRATEAGKDRYADELLPYALEEIRKDRLANSAKGISPRITRLVRDIVSYVKEKFTQIGLGNIAKSFNENDLYRLASVMEREFTARPESRPSPKKGGKVLDSTQPKVEEQPKVEPKKVKQTIKKKVTKEVKERTQLQEKDKARLKNVSITIPVEVDGKQQEMTGNALKLIEQGEKRVNMLEMLKKCVMGN